MKPLTPSMISPSAVADQRTIELPNWIAPGRNDSDHMAAFLSGGALALLHPLVSGGEADCPAALVRQRLALQATESCLTLEGRRDGEADIRDAVCLHRAGDALGPAGEMFDLWSRVARLPLTHRDWITRLVTLLPAALSPELRSVLAEAGRRDPVGNATAILVDMLRRWPRAETAALVCADVILARALGWAYPVPLLGWSVPRRMLRLANEETAIQDECHRALSHAAVQAVHLSQDLTHRANRLLGVAPRLRAKASDAAVMLFLSRDAVFPGTMLSPIVQGTSQQMTDRAARRLCDRLVALGVIRELSGRSSFRIYGV